MIRRSLPLLALLLLLSGFVGPAVAGEAADLEAEKQASRERLLRAARRALVGQSKRPDPFAPMQRQLADDHKRMMAYAPKNAEEAKLLDEFEKTIAERVLLIGWPDSGIEGVSSVGALQEALRLDLWLAGAEPCDVRVRDDKLPEGTWRDYAYPPLPKAEPEPDPPVEGNGLEAAPPSPPPDADGPDAPKEAEPEKAEPKTSKEAPVPVAPPSIEDWAKDVARTGEQGTLLRKELSTAVCGVVTALLRAAKQSPAFVHPEVRSLRRHAIVEEDVFAYNAPYVELRRLQADERNKALQGDQPSPSLVDQSMVDDKQDYLEQFAAQLELRRTQRRAVTESLDRMVVDLDEWRAQAALLSREIEQAQQARADEEKRATEEGRPPVPPSPADEIRLRLARARESLVSLDVTLLYMTALRAEKRLALLDRLVRAAADETTAAEQVKARYAAALMKLRSERRLDRLYGDQHRLRQWITQLEARDLPEGSVYEARLAAYRAVLSVSEIVVEAVDRRRAMAPGGSRLSEDDESSDEALAAPVDEGAAGEERKSPLARVLLKPGEATWDVKYVEIARRELEDPALQQAFDAQLIAEHYAAVDDRIRALMAAYREETEQTDLQGRFLRAHAAAEAALEPLLDDEWTVRGRKLPEMLANTSEDFQAAIEGIKEQGQRNRERLEALVDYRQRLRSQGTRSLLIRTDRDLADRDVRAALRDTKTAVMQAAGWVTMRDETHAGGFLQQAWFRLLVVLAIIAAAVLGVRHARRRIDVWIEERVAVNRVLRRAGASLREEKDEAKRRREEEDQAKPEVTVEEVLQQVVEAPVEAAPEGEEEAEDDEGPKGAAR